MDSDEVDQDAGRAPLLFCIDVEPDDHRIRRDGRSSFDGFARMYDELSDLRPRLEDATDQPVHFSWFIRMDPQIREGFGSAAYLFQREQARFSAAVAAGDELGVHTHAWRWDSHAETWHEAIDDPGWVEHCVESSLDAFTDATGLTCRSHRFGAGFFSDEIVDVLARRDIDFDLTCEPGMQLPVGNSIKEHLARSADHRSVPRRPYRPALGQFQRMDPISGHPITLIPLTSVEYGGAVRRLDRRLRGFAPPYHRTHMMWRKDLSPNRYWSLAHRQMTRQVVPYVAIAIRSDAVRDPVVLAKLHGLPAHKITRSVRFSTPSQWLGEH